MESTFIAAWKRIGENLFLPNGGISMNTHRRVPRVKLNHMQKMIWRRVEVESEEHRHVEQQPQHQIEVHKRGLPSRETKFSPTFQFYFRLMLLSEESASKP